MKKLYCDILTQKGTDYESRFFTIDDFLKILRTSFMSYTDFAGACYSKVPDLERRNFLVNNIFSFHDDRVFNSDRVRDIFPVVDNENKYAHTKLFQYKVLNFEKSKRIMFDFYINKQSNLFLNPLEEDAIIANANSNVEKGILFVRVINYSSRNGVPTPDYVDVNTRINVNYGMFDTQMRAIPWGIDQWINQEELKFTKDQIYLMAPLLNHCIKIYDKILLLSKQKSSYVSPSLLQNAIDASFNDGRIIMGMNDKYKLINNCFIRFVPNLKRTLNNVEYETSRFFNFVHQQRAENAFSYSDIVSGGSGASGIHKIRIEAYKEVAFELGIYDIIFTKEENTNNGLFAWINPEFVNLLNKYGKTFHADLSVLNNHVITIDYENERYISSINGPEPMMPLSEKKKKARTKKENARIKHNDSRTFPFDSTDQYNHSMITKDITNTPYFFHRNINYLSDSKELEVNDYTRNALVAFVDSDIDLPSIDDLVNMSLEDQNTFYYSLRGVACEGFFTSRFLQQKMIVNRTEKLKCAVEDTNPSFQYMVANKEQFIGKQMLNDEDKGKFLVRNYMKCKCSGKIVNNTCKSCGEPRPLDGELRAEYWASFNKNFAFVKIQDIKIAEDGIDIYVTYSIPLANSRFKCDELTKTVPVETAQFDIGYVKELNLGDIEIKDIDVPLDGIYFGIGGFKMKTNGIPFTALRLRNALNGDIKFSSADCINETEAVNEFLKTFKKSKVMTKMYDKESNQYKNKLIDAWVGIVALSPTEVSQEFNKSRSEEEKSFSKANYSLYNLLGFDALNKAISEESNIVAAKHDEYTSELFKIAGIHSSARPAMISNESTQMAKDMDLRHSELIKDCVNLTPLYKNQDNSFNVHGHPRYSLQVYITQTVYKQILETYPLFTDPKFEKGFIINCALGLNKQEASKYNEAIGSIEHTIYFPKRQILRSMFEIIGDNNVRISDLLAAYLNVFETLAVSKIGSAKYANTSSNHHLINKTNNLYPHSFSNVNGKILKAVNNELFYKEGKLNQLTNIAVARIMSKQLTDIDCSYDAAIVANDKEFRERASKVFAIIYPDREQDWDVEYDRQAQKYNILGWCWTETIYCSAVREPVLFLKQNLNIKEMWSSHRANLEYINSKGISFFKKHPGTKGIYLNPVFVTKDLEGDVDGDTIFLAIPQSVESQTEMANVFKLIKGNAFWDKDNTNPIAKLFRDTYFVPSLKYLLDEAENLNFKLDTLSIGYSYIYFAESLSANFEASKNKEAIGLLTVSLWYVTYFLDFYMFNYDRLVAKGYNIPKLTDRNKYEILFIFQYLLAQQNGVRAMKDDGSYGKVTIDNLIMDTEFEKDQPRTRELFTTLVTEYKAELAAENIDIDFTDSINSFYKIFDNLFISTAKFRGFGYSRTIEGHVFSFASARWTNGEFKYNQGGGKQTDFYYDCSSSYDKEFFLDFQSVFLLINGRNPDSFIAKFGYDKLLRSLEFKNKKHLHSPLLSFCKDIFVK